MQTEIYLRPMTVEDSSKIVTWRNREFVRKNFIYQELFTEESHLHWIETQVKPGHVVQFILCLEEGREIGSVYFRDIDRSAGTAEYGIFIGEEDALGKGYGTQAARLALQYAFEEMGLQKVFLRVLADNMGARKSYEHAGFRRIEGKKEQVTLQQGVREVVFMEIDREDYRKAQETVQG